MSSASVTEVLNGEILVRDGNRFHHLKEGKNLCLDY